MTVFLTHAGADREAADSLAKVFERRGLFVEDEDGGHGFRPLMGRDVVVLLWSQQAVFSHYRLQMERRALEAWAEDRLVLVKLDHGIPPVGLRDLPAVDASFEERRAFIWEDVVRAVQGKLTRRREEPAPPPMLRPPAPHPETMDDRTVQPPMAAPAKSGGGIAGAFAGLFLLLAVIAAAISAAVHFGLVPDLGMIALHPEVLRNASFLIGVGAALFALVLSLNAIGHRTATRRSDITHRSKRAAGAAEAQPSPQQAPEPAASKPAAVFISYAHADAAAVAPMADAVAREVRPVWIDKQGIQSGEGWAGEIVRGIRNAAGVVVMCSRAAYESDHVKREIYLADRYKKRLVPVLLDDSPAPEDFEYFFAGVQHLNAAGLSGQARADAIVQLAAQF
jgi:hypothetical protein